MFDDRYRRRGRGRLSATLVAVLLVLLGIGTVDGYGLSTANQVVDGLTGSDTSDLGTSSLVLDSADNPRISYYDAANGNLKYAAYYTWGWHNQTVDSAGNVGGSSSLALDSAGNPRISYYDATNGDLKYAERVGLRWYAETVDSVGDVGMYASLALDSAGNPRISYYDRTIGNLKYAWHDGSGWHTETVDSVGDVGRYSSLALDSAGNPRISYYDATSGDLDLAEWDGDYWSCSILDSAGDVGRYTSLAERGGELHISYFDATTGVVKYASHPDYLTTRITPISDYLVAQGPSSLALDNAGHPHILFTTSTDMWYSDGTTTGREYIEDGVDKTGRFCSLALDGADNLRISYWWQNGFLMYGGRYSPAQVTGMTPNSGVLGTSFLMTLTGNNFRPDSDCMVYLIQPLGDCKIIFATNVTIVSPTTLTCEFDLPLHPEGYSPSADPTAAPWKVEVLPHGQNTAWLTSDGFTISEPFTLTSATPNAGVSGATVSTTLNGIGFPPGVTVALQDYQPGNPKPVAAITGTNVVRVSDTQITCVFPLPSTASTGLWDVTVFHPDGRRSSLKNGFTVTAPATGPGLVPGGSAVPHDLDHDGLYEDVNGNGVLDFNDVVLFFNQMDWIAENEPVSAFDFNHNGQIDFNDIVILFNDL
jgi:PKD repeat protein